MVEIWEDIPNYEGVYQASTLGRIRSLDRMVNSVQGSRTVKGMFMQIHTSKSGYNFVILSKHNHYKHFRVHRLVLLTFVPNPENKPTGNHIDGNKLNNFLENLEWMTQKENIQHAIMNI